MTERVLSTTTLNRALLERQLLLERAELAVPEALERMGGLQDQYAPSGYVGLWSRIAGFRRDALTRSLVDRTVIQATLMRSTIHLVSAADYVLFAAGTRRARQVWYQRVERPELGGLDVPAAVRLTRDLLADGPRPERELRAALESRGHDRLAWRGVSAFLDLVRVPPSGTWERRRADLFCLAETWLGPQTATEEDGLEHLVRRYLGAFGPAPVPDIASWAGVPAPWLRPAVDAIAPVRHRDERGRELVDLPGAPLPDPDTPAPVRFLPTWDATLLVHARRTGILPERFRPLVFNTKTPHSVPTFLVDGRVAGTWRHDDGRVTVAPFEPLVPGVEAELREEATRLEAFHA